MRQVHLQTGMKLRRGQTRTTLQQQMDMLRAVDVTGVTNLQNVSSSVEFRLYYSGKTSQYAQIGIGRAFNGDSTNDLIVEGTISAVPEPSILALLGLAFLGLRAYPPASLIRILSILT